MSLSLSHRPSLALSREATARISRSAQTPPRGGPDCTKRDAGAQRSTREHSGVIAILATDYATSCIAICTCSVVTAFAFAIAAAKRA